MRLQQLTTPPCPLSTAPWWAVEASIIFSFLLTLGHTPPCSLSTGRVQSSVFLFCFVKMLSGGRAFHVCSFSYIYVRFSCIFASFVHLSSFNSENTKGRQKNTFSNISTKKGLVLCHN
ncbi:hypothetical protein HanIR_Chr13g0626391 [Helianthus annuus]|nr:hypothetical protein HanIR_Chr13g0626391 [Helianthus annuus]